MYFILSGTVGVGYHAMQQPLDKSRYLIVHNLGANNFFGDFYLINNIRSEFVYSAMSEVEAFSL